MRRGAAPAPRRGTSFGEVPQAPKNFVWRKTVFFAGMRYSPYTDAAKTEFLQDASFPLSSKESGGVKGQSPLRHCPEKRTRRGAAPAPRRGTSFGEVPQAPKNLIWRKTAFFAGMRYSPYTDAAKTEFWQDISFPLSLKESGGVKGQSPLRHCPEKRTRRGAAPAPRRGTSFEEVPQAPKNFVWRKTVFFAGMRYSSYTDAAKTEFLQDASFPLSLKESGGVKGQGPLRSPCDAG